MSNLDHKKQKSRLSEIIGHRESIINENIVGFFDLLARFDHEDKSKLNTGPLVSAPKESVFSLDKK